MLARVQLEPITLPGGWSGSALTRCQGVAPSFEGEVTLPPASQWAALLEPVTTRASSLPGYELLKYSRSGEVFRVRLCWDGGSIDAVCKQSRSEGAIGALLDRVRVSGARRQFNLGLRLLRAGIGTALPLAQFDQSAAPRASWLITRFLANVVDLDQVALTLLPKLDAHRTRLVKNNIIDSVVHLLAQLYEHGLYHRDLKATNILLSDWDAPDREPRTWLVDLEGLRPFGLLRRRRVWRPLVRLAASLLSYDAVTRTDYFRFLRAYLARTERMHRASGPLYLKLGRWATDYVRESRKRKTHKLDGYVDGH